VSYDEHNGKEEECSGAGTGGNAEQEVDPRTAEENCSEGGPSPMERGHVYFVETDNGEFVKIGFSKRPRLRMSELATLRPGAFALRPIGSMAGSRPVETWLHLVFAEDRDNGEWFRSTSRLRAFIALLPLVPIIELKPQLRYERRERPMSALIAESEPELPQSELEPQNADLPVEFTCCRCGHQWTRRKPGRPAQCPNCKQTRWDTPSKWATPSKRKAATK
jgi:hypothetical protein